MWLFNCVKQAGLRWWPLVKHKKCQISFQLTKKNKKIIDSSSCLRLLKHKPCRRWVQPSVNQRFLYFDEPKKYLEFTETPTMDELRRAIPKRCFQRSSLISLGYLSRDFLYVSVLAYGALQIPCIQDTALRLAAWTVYGFFQGLVGTGIWILAHECGQRLFLKYRAWWCAWVDSSFLTSGALFFLENNPCTPSSIPWTHGKRYCFRTSYRDQVR